MRLAIFTLALFLLAGALAGIYLTDWTLSERPAPLLRFLRPAGAFEREAAEVLDREGPSGRARAEEFLKRALLRDPASAYRWAALAESYLESGKTEQAGYCFQRALELGPRIPPILIRAANFELQLDRPDEAMRYGKRILALIKDYDAVVFALYQRMGIPVERVLEGGIPATQRAGLAYFGHLLESATPADARKAWLWVGKRAFADDKTAAQYIGYLLRHNEYGAAAEAWPAYLGKRRGDYPDANRLFNGGFESGSTGAALDWRIREADGATAARERGVARSGDWSLRIDFLGQTNVAFEHVMQNFIATPGKYRLRAYVRTDGLTTDQGIRLRIADAEEPARLELLTDAVLRAREWTVVEKVFTVPAASRLVQVQLVRQPSLKFENKIRGTAWVDDMTVTPAP